jgi:hypothetical protein
MLRYALLLLLLPWHASAQDDPFSVSSLLVGCQRAAETSKATGLMAVYNEGTCVGVVAGLIGVRTYLDAQHRFCMPQDANVGQAVKIVAKFGNDRPDIRHLELWTVALMALRQAWPCR